MAVDVCSKGVHAIVEIEQEIPQGRRAPPHINPISLLFQSRGSERRTSLDVSGPVCRAAGFLMRPSDRRRVEEAMAGAPAERCFYFIHAEFELSRLPARGDTLTVLYGSQRIRLPW